MYSSGYYKNKYMLAFYDKKDTLRFIFDNVREIYEHLGITTTKYKKYLNTRISLHLSGHPQHRTIRCFKEPMKIHLIEVDE